jgi:hypothetical protein
MLEAKKKVALANELVAGVMATAALGAGVVLHLPVIAAAGAAVAVYGGLRLLLPSPRTGGEDLDAVTKETIARGRRQISVLESLAANVKPSVRASVVGICRSAREIFAMFETSPAKAAMARGFVDFTLTRTVTVLQRYNELSSRTSATAQETLAKTETLLSMIDTSFREQLDKLVREDAADLDSEIELLKTRLEVEGDTEL